MITHKQLSLADIFQDCQNKFDHDKYQFLTMLDEVINLDEIVPDASKFTRFKQTFLPDLQNMFERLVDLTEPICQKIDLKKASMILFDTSGIEAWVKENNPQYTNSIIRQFKALIPVLKDFFEKHPLINPKAFLGDAAFDSIEIYKYLLQETSFEKAYIPLKGRLSLPESDCSLNEDGIPCCPNLF